MAPDEPNGNVLAYRVGELEHDVREVTKDVRGLQDWQAEVRGAFSFARAALGTSVLAAIVSIVTLVTVLAGR